MQERNRKLIFLRIAGLFSLILVALLVIEGIPRKPADGARPNGTNQARPTPAQAVVDSDAYRMVLLPISGDSRLDQDIARTQAAVRQGGPRSDPCLERLGWLFVSKARVTFDPGYYKLAEQCAACLNSRHPRCPEALLLRGHVLHNLHRFKEAEPLARELVARRGLSFDYGLLGDVLMEQGRLDEAVAPYQKMVDQKPDLQAYVRIAHLRWLKGDLRGATQVMGMAVSAASPNASESAAWVNTRLAFYEFQNGDIQTALLTCEVALDYQKDYAPALLMRGRLLLAQGKTSEAVSALQRATQFNPLPDYEWTLAEALRASDNADQADKVEARLNQEGAAADPRTFSLYLASQGKSLKKALELAQNEFKTRSDIFTHDALAWALAANGSFAEADQEMQHALVEGTKDARLFFHATVIAAKAGHKDAAQQWLLRAAELFPLLLPSEQKQLQITALELGKTDLDAGFPKSTKTLFTAGNSTVQK